MYKERIKGLSTQICKDVNSIAQYVNPDDMRKIIEDCGELVMNVDKIKEDENNYNAKLLSFLEKHNIGPMQFANIVQIETTKATDLVLRGNDMDKDEYDELIRKVKLYI